VNTLDLALGHDDRRPGVALCPGGFDLPFDRLIEHRAVEEDDRISGLTLGGGGDLLLNGKVAQFAPPRSANEIGGI